jgi:hypothetical protein
LRHRVLEAANEAWEAEEPASAEIPWTVPVIRFAASIAIAVLLIGFAGGTRPELGAAPRATPISYPEVPGISSISKRNAVAVPWPDPNPVDSLLRYQRWLREMLKSTS